MAYTYRNIEHLPNSPGREDSADQEYSNGVIISIAFTCTWKPVVIEFNYLNGIEKF